MKRSVIDVFNANNSQDTSAEPLRKIIKESQASSCVKFTSWNSRLTIALNRDTQWIQGDSASSHWIQSVSHVHHCIQSQQTASKESGKFAESAHDSTDHILALSRQMVNMCVKLKLNQTLLLQYGCHD